MHGHVAARLRVQAVDPPDVLLDGAAQLAVLAHVVPARHRELQERQGGAQLGLALKQHLDRQQALDDSLGVVEPVGAEQQGPAAELLFERGDVVLHRGVGR